MIDDSASFGYCLETDLIMLNLDQHEMIVFVIARCPERASEIDAAAVQVAAGAGDEVLNALLR